MSGAVFCLFVKSMYRLGPDVSTGFCGLHHVRPQKMDFANLEEWLKTTIPGIIVLGALGSIAAAAFSWLVNRYVPIVAKNALRAAIKRLLLHFVSPSVKHAVRLHFMESESKRGSFFAYQLMKFGAYLFVSMCGFIAFAVLVASNPEPLLRASVVASAGVFFLSAWRALRMMVVMAVPLFYDIDSQVKRAKEEFLAQNSPPEA